MDVIAVRESSQVGAARRAALEIATGLGFGETATARVGIVVTELATNLVKHGAGGEILLGAYEDDTGGGFECLALDKGPGMRDVDACFEDGFSTAGSQGTGLGAIRRQSQTLEIYSQAGGGTAILARLSEASTARPAEAPSYGAVATPYPGETAIGDAWRVQVVRDSFGAMVADGLGHGLQAAEASHAAVRAFREAKDLAPSAMLERMHAQLRGTRGAAVSVARYEEERGVIVYAGIGNVAGTLISDGAARRLVCHNGIVGHAIKRVQAFEYPAAPPFLLVLASDGLATSWTLDAYPGLRHRHPTLIAAVLYRDFNRGRDDVTVLVIQVGAP